MQHLIYCCFVAPLCEFGDWPHNQQPMNLAGSVWFGLAIYAELRQPALCADKCGGKVPLLSCVCARQWETPRRHIGLGKFLTAMLSEF